MGHARFTYPTVKDELQYRVKTVDVLGLKKLFCLLYSHYMMQDQMSTAHATQAWTGQVLIMDGKEVK